jgi:hypothetical protein
MHKFVGKVESISIDPHAGVGNVGNEAVARWIALYELDLRQTCKGIAARLAFFLSHRQVHGEQLQVAERASTNHLIQGSQVAIDLLRAG